MTERTIGVSRTARYVALYRALETGAPRPRFRDPFATAFLTADLAMLVRAARLKPFRRLLTRYADRRAPGARTSAIARTCFIDEVVRRRAAAGVRQVVLLGAGFDCRAHRLPELREAAVYEVDRAETQAYKRDRLRQVTLPVRGDVHYVAVDFLRDDPAQRLAAEGWDAGAPTLFIWEGVTNYLTEAAVVSVLSWIGRGPAGSAVVFTYVHGGLLDGSARFDGGEHMMRNVRELGEPWTFGLHPPQVAPFVERCGLCLVEDLNADEYRARYLKGAEPQRGYAFYRIAVAEIRARS